MPSPFLKPTEAAEYLNVAVGSLSQWRHRGVGPRYFRLNNGLVRYRQEAVDEWLAAQEAATVRQPQPAL